MNIEKLNPIPKKILDKIKTLDKKDYPFPCNFVRFYSYLTTIQKEIVKVTIAVKTVRDVFCCKQVAVHGLHSPECYVRDMEYVHLGMGYSTGWHDHFLYNIPKGYEDGKWYRAERKFYNPYSKLVNANYLSRFAKYKYSAYNLFNGKCILEYLRVYEKHPQVELLLKIGVSSYHATKTMLLNKLEKDKLFRKWLVENKDDLHDSLYSVKAILQAYKDKVTIWQAQTANQRLAQIKNGGFCFGYEHIATIINNDWYKFFNYLDVQDISLSLYFDYLTACEYLELDMSQAKNLYPKDFMRWHDIRIDEMKTAKALKVEREKQKMISDFMNVAIKYMPLERNKEEPFICIIAQKPEDLVHEGECLDHCVGRMNYDQRMAKEQSLIFFVRNIKEPEKPFVTVEYSLTTHKVLQSYGYHDTKPADEVLTYINKVWLPYANRKIKQIA